MGGPPSVNIAMVILYDYNGPMDQESVKEVSRVVNLCRSELGKRIVGQHEMIDGVLMALIADGHTLLEGVPGLAKTLLVKSLAELTGLAFKRIQFTPDLLPADVTGTLVWDQRSGTFSVRRGPIFANVILADEINRSPAKVQSALLEAMEEHQVTIGDETHPLPDPFFVLATQNPIEHEGTYPLPEAELDRFLIKLLINYPHKEEEGRIVRLAAGTNREGPPINPILTPSLLTTLRSAVEAIRVDDKILDYMVALVSATRPTGDKKRSVREDLYRYISFGASPRASMALYRCARIRSIFEGRDFVNPEDVKAVAPAVLRHRLVLSYEAEADGLDADAVIARILAFVPVP